MKRIAAMIGAVFVGGSLMLAGPAAASAGSIQVQTPGQVGTSRPASSVTEQDTDEGMTDGAKINNSGTQGTIKAAAVDGQVNASGTQGQMKSAATDGTETTSVMVTPQFKAH